MAELGLKARRLLHEVKGSDFLPIYSEDGVKAVHKEIAELHQEIQDTLAARREGEALPLSVKIGLSVHGTALWRNKRCLLAYARYRADKVSQLRWETGTAIPEALRPNLSPLEVAYFNEYDKLLTDYQQEVELDLTADLTPPRNLLIEVRALVDCGETFTDNGLVRLDKGSSHLLRRSDVEYLIRQGKLEHLDSEPSA